MNTYTHLPMPKRVRLNPAKLTISTRSTEETLQRQTDELIATADELQDGNSDVATLCKEAMGKGGALSHWAYGLERASRSTLEGNPHPEGSWEAESRRAYRAATRL